MIRSFCLTIAWFGFSIIAAEIFNSFEVLDERVNVMVIAIPMTLVYIGSKLVLRHYQIKSTESDQALERYRKVEQHYYLALGSISLFMFVIIPLVWWGVIKKLAQLGAKSMAGME